MKIDDLKQQLQEQKNPSFSDSFAFIPPQNQQAVLDELTSLGGIPTNDPLWVIVEKSGIFVKMAEMSQKFEDDKALESIRADIKADIKKMRSKMGMASVLPAQSWAVAVSLASIAFLLGFALTTFILMPNRLAWQRGSDRLILEWLSETQEGQTAQKIYNLNEGYLENCQQEARKYKIQVLRRGGKTRKVCIIAIP